MPEDASTSQHVQPVRDSRNGWVFLDERAAFAYMILTSRRKKALFTDVPRARVVPAVSGLGFQYSVSWLAYERAAFCQKGSRQTPDVLPWLHSCVLESLVQEMYGRVVK